MYNFGRPEAVDVHRRFRTVAEEFDPERLLLGETYVLELEKLMEYVVPDGLQLCMNFVFLHAPFAAERLAGRRRRAPSRCCRRARRRCGTRRVTTTRGSRRAGATATSRDRCALVGLLSLRGACILFQGDEIGIEALPVPPERERDMAGRDPCRTPMVWRDEDGAGFTDAGRRAVAADRRRATGTSPTSATIRARSSRSRAT